MENFKDFLTVKQAASLLGVSASTLRNWDLNHKLKTIRHPINKYRLYKKSELETLLKKLKGGINVHR